MIETLKDLFYRSHFEQLIEVDASLLSQKQRVVEVQLLRSAAYLERAQIPQAQSTLIQLQSLPLEDAQAMLKTYALARLSYMVGDYLAAQKLFLQLKKEALQFRDRRSLLWSYLGLANLAYTQRDYDALNAYLLEMDQIERVPEELISLLLLKGHFAFYQQHDFAHALDLYSQALSEATDQNWNYFQIRALYFICVTHAHQRQWEAYKNHKDIFMAMHCPKREPYFAEVVRRRFGQQLPFVGPLQLDQRSLSLTFNGEQIELSNKALVFRFIDCLNASHSSISKVELANALWPTETYSKYSHDPRIFDLAKRSKDCLKKLGRGSLQIHADRQGYRLLQSEGV